jgi:hypothetical protein
LANFLDIQKEVSKFEFTYFVGEKECVAYSIAGHDVALRLMMRFFQTRIYF